MPPTKLELMPSRRRWDATRVSWEVGRVELRIRRHHCLVDAAKALENLPSHKWREPWYVTFANESALDAGGPSREFFRLPQIYGCDAFCGNHRGQRIDSRKFPPAGGRFLRQRGRWRRARSLKGLSSRKPVFALLRHLANSCEAPSPYLTSPRRLRRAVDATVHFAIRDERAGLRN